MLRARALLWLGLSAGGILLIVLAMRSRAAPPIEGLPSAAPQTTAPASVAPADGAKVAAPADATAEERTPVNAAPPKTVVRGVIARQDDDRPIMSAKALLVLQRRGEPAPPPSAVRPWIVFTDADGAFELALDLDPDADAEWDGSLYLYYPGFHLSRLPVANLAAGRTYELGRQLLTPETEEERAHRKQRRNLSARELRALLKGDPMEALQALEGTGATDADRTPR